MTSSPTRSLCISSLASGTPTTGSPGRGHLSSPLRTSASTLANGKIHTLPASQLRNLERARGNGATGRDRSEIGAMEIPPPWHNGVGDSELSSRPRISASKSRSTSPAPSSYLPGRLGKGFL
ncbi:hypothetical protein NE237_020294 [Protea cynaroides]|uniref:Uncharacterized protein n=1 Tax=Protea cynaroides TaxID=273540 RepID=A0A9Q0HAT7_9MAGN|nr:hypothetical protein NE237_020294 [Protea cynaroides]